MTVYVGETDPLYKIRQLQNLGDSVASAIGFAKEAKEKKQLKIRREFEDAMELAQADPEAGLLAIDAMKQRTKPKLLNKSVPDLAPYEAMLQKRSTTEGREEAAYQAWSESVMKRMQRVQRAQDMMQTVPEAIPLDIATDGPGAIMEGMLTGNTMKPNPEFGRRQALLKKATEPYALARAALADLSDVDQVQFQVWAAGQGLTMEQIVGEVQMSSLTPTAKTLIYSGQEGADPTVAQAARIGADLELSPVQINQREWETGMDELERGYKEEDYEREQAGRVAMEDKRQAGRVSLAERQSELRQKESDQDARLKAEAAGPAEAKGERTADQVLADRDDLTIQKYPIDTDTKKELKQMAKETAAGMGLSEGDAMESIVNVYQRLVDETPGKTKAERAAKAIKKMWAIHRGEQVEEDESGAAGGHRATRRGSRGRTGVK